MSFVDESRPSGQTEVEPDLIIRASSLAEYFDCSARWQAKHLLGMWMPSGAPAAIGTAVHAGTANFDGSRLTGGEAKVEDALDAAADSVRQAKEVRWDDVRPAEAIDIAVKLTNNYCHDIAPQFTYRKVEAKLDHLDVIATNGVRMRFTGHVDREFTVGDEFGIADFKTGRQIVSASSEVKVSVTAAQLGTYELIELMTAGTEHAAPTLPAKIIAMPTAGKQQPKIVEVNNPRSLLIGDERQKGLIDIAADIYKHDLFVGNPRSMLCSEKYCPAWAKCRWRLTGE